MRPFHCKTIIAAFSFLIAAALVGCSSGPKEEASTEGDTAKTEKPAKKKAADKKAVAAGTGTLKGKVTLEGAKPDTASLNAQLLEAMKQKADDKDVCLSPDATPEEKEQQRWRIGADNGLANVVVFLAPAEGTFFEITDSHPGVQAVKGKEAAIDQPHCAFIPHAMVLFPSYTDAKTKKKVSTGQQFVVKNSAKITHNTKYTDGGYDNPGDNLLIKPGGTIKVPELKPSSRDVTVQCTIHPWMSANIWVLNNPYYAVTDKDGNFEIKNVPAADVNVVAWHEAGKFLNSGGSKGEKITLADNETTKNFTAKMPK